LHNFFVNTSNASVMNVSCPIGLNWVFKVAASCSNTTTVSFEITGLPYQWTPVANHSIL